MTLYRSARGRMVDMTRLEREFSNATKMTAVTPGGPVRNVRGDILGHGGKIEKSVEELNREIGVRRTREAVSLAESRKTMSRVNEMFRNNEVTSNRERKGDIVKDEPKPRKRRRNADS